MSGAVAVLLSILALPFVAVRAYLALLVARSRVPKPPAPGAGRLRFDVVVPAHDEEAGIAATVRSLSAMEYPNDRFRVLVVADNCKDRTAEVARAAGATVLERKNETLRGKGYALALAFAQSLAGDADAVVVVDADTVVSPNLLRAFEARLAAGALAVQAEYAIRNPDSSWRTRLLRIAFALFHTVRSSGRESLGLSCSLHGNGMCFTRLVLKEVPYEAFSLVEDVEYALRLGEHGFRVHYAHEAFVYGEMVSGGEGARTQRERWEAGRRLLARERGWPLLSSAIRRGDPILFDLALNLLVPPFARVAAGVFAGLLASIVFALLHGPAAVPLMLWGFCALALLAYLFRGWALSGTGARGLRDLAFAPAYVVWKMGLALRPKSGKNAWIRTARENTAEADRPAK
jgi:1,2-diacylglycerol 3-beta-glucosyltransferase